MKRKQEDDPLCIQKVVTSKESKEEVDEGEEMQYQWGAYFGFHTHLLAADDDKDGVHF